MDYEKKYKQLHTFISDLYPFMSEYCKEKVEGFLPELKESEDERIRKWLIGYFQRNKVAENIKTHDILAWLEKQGEQETLCGKCRKEQPSHSCQDITSLGRCAVEHEQKPAKDKGMNLEEEEMTPFQKEVFYIIDTNIEAERGLKQECDKLLALASNEIEQKPYYEHTNIPQRDFASIDPKFYKQEQKPAWSEEDEKMMMFCCDYLDDDQINWLKSIKERLKGE